MRLFVVLALLGACAASPIGELEKEYKKEGMDLKELKADIEDLSKEVEVEFANGDAQDELVALRAHYDKIYGNQTLNKVSYIEDVNSEVATELFEGDILLTPEQWKVAKDLDPNQKLVRRQALTVATKLWTPVGAPIIYYKFAPGFPALTQSRALEAMRFWEERTCAKFQPAPAGQRDYVYFQNKPEGCYSNVGKAGGAQALNLQTPGCEMLSIVAHEVSHAFGTLHVQSRSDRDQFVSIDTANIQRGMEHNFAREPGTGYYGPLSNYGVPYEFGSMQHYTEFSFAIDSRRPTIIARQPYSNYQKSFEAPRATFWDTVLINNIYKCTDRCRTKVTCYNGGVPDGRDCNKCFCPRGWAGNNCQSRPSNAQIVQVNQNGQRLRVSVESPAQGFEEKLYILQAPAGRKIRLTINSIGANDNRCIFNGMEVIFAKDTRSSGYRFCSAPRVNNITSEGDSMLIWVYKDKPYPFTNDVTISLV